MKLASGYSLHPGLWYSWRIFVKFLKTANPVRMTWKTYCRISLWASSHTWHQQRHLTNRWCNCIRVLSPPSWNYELRDRIFKQKIVCVCVCVLFLTFPIRIIFIRHDVFVVHTSKYVDVCVLLVCFGINLLFLLSKVTQIGSKYKKSIAVRSDSQLLTRISKAALYD